MKPILTRWLPFILYAALIFYVSSQKLPELPTPFQIDYIDLIAHFLEYALFAYLCWRAFSTIKTNVLQKHLLFVILVLSILYGFSDELHQYYVPGRQMDVFDFIADSAGAIAVVSLLWIKQVKHERTVIN